MRDDPLCARRRMATAVLLAVVLLAGAYLRLVRLGQSSLRADSITFFAVCRSDMGPWDIVKKWGQLGLDHPPFTLAATKWMIDMLGLPVTETTLTLLPAIFGILTVPVMFLIGRKLAGRSFGLLLAAMLAFHPIHIQVSREAYHYALLILGSSLMLLAVLDAFLSIRDRRDLGWRFLLAAGLGLVGLTFSTFTGWSIAFVEGVAILGALVWRWKKQGMPARIVWQTILLLGLLSLPVLLSPWGIANILAKLGGPQKEMVNRGMVGYEGTIWMFLLSVVTMFGWGATPVRVAFSVLVLASSLLVVRDRDRRQVHSLCCAILVAGILIFLAMRRAINATYSSRYVAVLLPVYLVILGSGIVGWVRALPRGGAVIAGGLAAGAAMLCASPALAATRLTGQPIPYRDVQTWFNTHLEKGTLVLVDRWFDPWNELRVYNSTNIFFTFTIPNEPVDVYLQHNWRGTAERFFEQFPDAAYLEISKSHWQVPEVGPWDWPRRFFRQHVVITNEAGLALWEMGLQNRDEDRYRNMVEIFYNTREDVVAKAREAARPWLILFGPEWGYAKLWRELNDFRDWRVLNEAAQIEVYNLADRPTAARLRIHGVAAGGAKKVRLEADADFVFPNGQIVEWVVGPLNLAPGLNRFRLVDTLWGGAGVPLLVDSIRAEEAATPAETQTVAQALP